MTRFKYWLLTIIKGYSPYTLLNGVKIRNTGPMSVNREDAIKANWDMIKKLCGKAGK